MLYPNAHKMHTTTFFCTYMLSRMTAKLRKGDKKLCWLQNVEGNRNEKYDVLLMKI